MKEITSEGRNTCVGCGAISPPAQNNYSLITARFGWRLTRNVDGAGHRILEWRCRDCWTKWKNASDETVRMSRR